MGNEEKTLRIEASETEKMPATPAAAEALGAEAEENGAGAQGAAVHEGGAGPEPSSKRNVKWACVAAAVVIAAGLGIAAVNHMAQQPDITDPQDEDAALVGQPEDAAVKPVVAGLEGYEPEEGAMPVIVHVSGKSEDGAEVDYYHAFQKAEGELELEAGSYELEYVPVLKADGSLVSAADRPAVKVEGGAEAAKATVTAEAKPADQVSAEEVEKALDKVNEAVAKGDETLKGDAGKKVVETAAANATASGKVDAAKAEEKKAEGEQKAEEPAAPSAPAAPSTPAAGQQAPAGNGGSESAPSQGNAQVSAPAQHEHNWVAQTEQRWVQDSAAWDEPIYQTEERAICAGCGADITNAISAHYTRKGCVNGSNASNWRYVTNTVQVGTTHHDATGHYETVTTGYICSGCGAIK